MFSGLKKLKRVFQLSINFWNLKPHSVVEMHNLMQSHASLPNLCAKEFEAVLDGSPMTNVDKGIESCRQTNNR